jgi:hypothetical protein
MDCSFEKNTRLDFLSDCHKFFTEKHPTILKRMTAMGNTVGNLFLLLNTNYAHDSVPLTVGSEELSKCLRDALTQPESGTLLANLEHNTRAERHTALDMAEMDEPVCRQSVLPQWQSEVGSYWPHEGARENEMLHSAPAASLEYFSEAEIAMANNSAAATTDMDDLWPAEWWDEMLACRL